MSATNQATGKHGEQIACAYLQRQEYTILATNWRCVGGEIDIVAQQGEIVVFIEVKTRRTASIDEAFAAITPRKRERMVRAAYAYLEAHYPGETGWRIDAIAIALPPAGKSVMQHVTDALDW